MEDFNVRAQRGVDAIKQRFENKDMVAQATSLALNEMAREFKLGDENVRLISKEVSAALQEFNSEEHAEKVDDLRLIALDTAEGIMGTLGFDQPELLQGFRDAYGHYFAELSKEKAQ